MKPLFLSYLAALRRPSRARLVSVLLLIGVSSLSYYAILRQRGIGALEISPNIMVTASASYCTEGDPAETCSPGQGLYSGTATGNTVETSVTAAPAPDTRQNQSGRKVKSRH